eukprot:30803-Pelagococcus_subviridis.AAC.5
MRPPRTTTDATASVCTHQRRYDAGRLLHDGDDAPPGDDEGPPRCPLHAADLAVVVLLLLLLLLIGIRVLDVFVLALLRRARVRKGTVRARVDVDVDVDAVGLPPRRAASASRRRRPVLSADPSSSSDGASVVVVAQRVLLGGVQPVEHAAPRENAPVVPPVDDDAAPHPHDARRGRRAVRPLDGDLTRVHGFRDPGGALQRPQASPGARVPYAHARVVAAGDDEDAPRGERGGADADAAAAARREARGADSSGVPAQSDGDFVPGDFTRARVVVSTASAPSIASARFDLACTTIDVDVVDASIDVPSSDASAAASCGRYGGSLGTRTRSDATSPSLDDVPAPASPPPPPPPPRRRRSRTVFVPPPSRALIVLIAPPRARATIHPPPIATPTTASFPRSRSSSSTTSTTGPFLAKDVRCSLAPRSTSKTLTEPSDNPIAATPSRAANARARTPPSIDVPSSASVASSSSSALERRRRCSNAASDVPVFASQTMTRASSLTVRALPRRSATPRILARCPTHASVRAHRPRVHRHSGSFRRSKRRRGGVERRQLKLKGVAVCRGSKARDGGRRNATGRKVLKERRSRRQRGRVGTSVSNAPPSAPRV